MDFPLKYLHFDLDSLLKSKSCTVNISEMMKYMANVTIANKYKVEYDLSIGIFTFNPGPFNNQGQDHAVNICKMVTDMVNITIAIKYEIAYGLLLLGF